MTLSKMWDKLHVNPLAQGQRWYCWCMGRYLTKYGIIVEFIINDVPHYCWAPFPVQGLVDAKALMVEGRMSVHNAKSPDHLYTLIKAVKPVASESLIKERADMKGSFNFVNISFSELPVLDWNQVFALAEDMMKTANL